jgi:DnaJ-domain-containing protein 1
MRYILRRALVLFLLNTSCWIALAGCLQTIEPGEEWEYDDMKPGEEWEYDDMKPEDHEKAKKLAALQETVIQLCYEILGVERNASLREITKAYHRLARKYHPDKKKGMPENIFQAISEANKILQAHLSQEIISEDLDKESKSSSVGTMPEDLDEESKCRSVKENLRQGLLALKNVRPVDP